MSDKQEGLCLKCKEPMLKGKWFCKTHCDEWDKGRLEDLKEHEARMKREREAP